MSQRVFQLDRRQVLQQPLARRLQHRIEQPAADLKSFSTSVTVANCVSIATSSVEKLASVYPARNNSGPVNPGL